MATLKQIEANRRNAQKSTGPRTTAGREQSRLNAVKHGLSRKLPTSAPADTLVLPLARAIAGEGERDPAALALAEQIALQTLTLSAIRRRLELMAALFSPLDETDAVMGVSLLFKPPLHPLRALRSLERYERNALARRSRALWALERLGRAPAASKARPWPPARDPTPPSRNAN